MIWLNLKTTTLRSPEYAGSEPIQRATWLNLLAYCCEQENGGRIEGCGEWKDRQWQQTLGVTLGEVREECALWHWEDGALCVAFYPTDKQEEVKAKRDAGKRGGSAKTEAKTQAARHNGAKHQPKQNPSTTQAATQRKGKERKDKGKEEEIGGGTLPPVLDSEDFKAAWGDYVTYRKQAKLRRLQPMSVRDQWSEMEGWGHDEAVEAIRTTIRKGWQGIFKPKANGTNHNGAAHGIRDRKDLLSDGTGKW